MVSPLNLRPSQPLYDPARLFGPFPADVRRTFLRSKEFLMRFKLAFLVAAIGIISFAATALAQRPDQPGQQGGRGGRGPGGGPPGMGGGMITTRTFLLSIAEVRKELELADEQVEAITKLADELREKYFGRGGPGGGGPGRRGNNNEGALRIAPPSWYFVAQEVQNQPGQGRSRGGFGGPPPTPEQRAEFENRMVERAREEKAKLAEILLPHQIQRLNEIFIQQAGATALFDEDVAQQLAINDGQKAKLTEARQANEETRREQFREAFQLDENARRAKFEEIRKASDAKLIAVLTPDQQKKFEAMKGKPFAMPENAFRFGGPGGGPGRRPGGNNN
jgi:hypothetical protein